MQRLLIFAFVLALSVFTAACADDLLTQSRGPNASEQSSIAASSPAQQQISPHAVLSMVETSRISGADRAHLGKRRGPPGDGSFSSPLFGLATAPNGDILVADAGAGVSDQSGVTEISLPGITDIGPIGRRSLWATKGLTGDPGDDTGQALYRLAKGKKRMIADLFEFEQANNPDGASLIDSNPFDVQSLGEKSALVADAGANALLRVDNQGNIQVVALFPSELVSTANIKSLVGCPAGPPGICGLPAEIPAQSVPTSIAIGPSGDYYVGELKGFPAPTGASHIWRIDPDASGVTCGSSPDCQKVFDGAFTSVIDLAFDASGILHVAELDEESWFAVESLTPADLTGGTINECDLDIESCTERATGIPILTSITFGTDGTLWATKNALIPGSAEVISVP